MGNRAPGALGADAEQFACDFLRAQGLRLLDRNFRCRGGEIDLIMQHDSVLVFVEVRYRTSSRFTRAALTVDIHKQRKLIRTASLYLARRPGVAGSIMRFDVVAVEQTPQLTCDWIKDAFRPTDSSL